MNPTSSVLPFPTQVNSLQSVETGPLPISLTHHALGLFTIVTGGTISFAFLLDLVGLPIRVWTVAPPVAILIALFGWNFLRYVSKGKYVRYAWDWPEFWVFMLVLAGMLAYGLWLGRPDQLPVGTTVDAVHQYGLADYIEQSGKLPIHAVDQHLNLQDGLEYPPGFVILVSLLSQLSGIDSLNWLHPLAVLMLAVGTGATFAIACLLLQDRSWRLAGAGGAAACVLLPYAYTFGSFISQTYYAQITAQAFLMVSLFMLLTWCKQGDAPALVLFGILVAALFITYPTLALIPLLSFGVTIIFNRRWRALAYVYFSVGILAVLFLKDRLQTGLGTIANEGQVLTPDLARFGWPIVGLATVGLASLLLNIGRSWFSKNFNQNLVLSSVVTLFAGLVAGEGLGLWLLKVWFNSGSYYAVYKMFYPAIYLLPLLAVIGLNWLVQFAPKTFSLFRSWRKRLDFVLSIGIFGAILTSTWLLYPVPTRAFAPISQAEVNVARWMQSHLKLDEYNVGYSVSTGGTAYWLQIGLFKQPRDTHSNDLLNGAPLSFDGWFYAPNSPQYLFSDNAQDLKLDERTQILYQSGNVAVLTRTPAYQESLNSQPRLAIQYTMQLDKNLLSLRIQATMSEEFTHWLGVGLQLIRTDDGNDVFTLAAPAEKDRTKQQFLGVSLTLPQLTVKEFYSDNNFPTAPHTSPLAPGRYSIYVVLQKQSFTTERRKLLDFESDAGGNLKYEPTQHIIQGQFLFEGELPQSVTALTPLDFGSDPKIRLTGLALPAQATTGSTITAVSQWQALTTNLPNFRLQWQWLDTNDQVATQTESLPRDGLYPTWVWSNAKPTFISQKLQLPSQAGRYQLAITLVDIDTGLKSTLQKTGKYITVN